MAEKRYKAVFDPDSDRLLDENLIPGDPAVSVEKRLMRSSYKLHWHNFYEIELILSGEGTHILNGTVHPLEKGDLYLVTPVDFHEMQVSQPVELINLMFGENMVEPGILQQLLNPRRPPYLHLPPEEFCEISFYLGQLLKEYRSDRPYRPLLMRGLLECLFLKVFRKIDLALPGAETGGSPVHRALFYLHGHFRENPSLGFIARYAGVSPNYFSELFHREVGVTFQAYCNGLRLDYAGRLLRSSGLTETAICYASGFGSLSHFFREFKKRYGMSPSQFRGRPKDLGPAGKDFPEKG